MLVKLRIFKTTRKTQRWKKRNAFLAGTSRLEKLDEETTAGNALDRTSHSYSIVLNHRSFGKFGSAHPSGKNIVEIAPQKGGQCRFFSKRTKQDQWD